MTHPAYSLPTDDWQISILIEPTLSFGIRVGGALWKFESERLNYRFLHTSGTIGVGASIGFDINIPGADSVAAAVSTASRAGLRSSQDHYRIHRPFSARDTELASMNGVSFGATAFVFEGAGRQYTVTDRRNHELFSFHGGEIGASFGIEVNLFAGDHMEFKMPTEPSPAVWWVLDAMS